MTRIVSLVLSLSLPLFIYAGPTDKKPTAEQSMADGEAELARAEEFVQQGKSKEASEKYESALFYFTAAHDLAPEATGPLLAMGIVLTNLNRCPDALKRLDEYILKKGAEANPSAQQNKEKCLARLGQAAVVSFRTKPSAAEVAIQQGSKSVSLGLSPTNTKILLPGVYEVTFSVSGREPVTRSLKVEAGDEKQLYANLNRKRLSRLSWDPGALGVPRAFWWTSAGLLVGAGAATATLLFVAP
jgi:tetratricopeptide (TPR) repeat protein